MSVGVLAIQGDVEEHVAVTSKFAAVFEVRTSSDLDAVDALIIPGGESTTLSSLLDEALREALRKRIESGMAVLGTCAGAILLAKNVTNTDGVAPLKAIDITIERNSYGRQTESFEAEVIFLAKPLRGAFIRAPRIINASPEVSILATLGDDPVIAQQGNIVVATFHPELVSDDALHRYFIREVVSA